MEKKRILYFDLLKVFAIFNVLYFHCLMYLSTTPYMENAMWRWLYLFNNPLFMMLSGYFSYKSLRKDECLEFIEKRFCQLIIPVLIWPISILLINIALSGNIDSGYALFVYKEYFWFLKSLFICCLISLVAFMPSGHRLSWIIISLILSQTVVVWNVYTMYPCFLTGLLIAKHYETIILHSKKLLIVSAAIFLSCNTYIVITPYSWDIGIGMKKLVLAMGLNMESVRLISYVYFIRLCHTLAGIVGALFFILLFKQLFENSGRFAEKIASYGNYTMGIYLVQTVIIEGTLRRLVSFGDISVNIFNFIVAPLLSLLLFLLCAEITRFATSHHNMVTDLLFGRFRLKNLHLYICRREA